MKVLRTKRTTYIVEVNEDGTLKVFVNGEKKPFENAGSLIYSIGGIEATIAKCEEYTPEMLSELMEREKAERETQLNRSVEIEMEKAEKAEKAFNEVFKDGYAETTVHSVCVLLDHLNHQNWGSWRLPKMSIGYACHQYDCDGKQATTITLDEPMEFLGTKYTKFQVGAPKGHLTKYHPIFEL